jgi:hypothetical protein
VTARIAAAEDGVVLDAGKEVNREDPLSWPLSRLGHAVDVVITWYLRDGRKIRKEFSPNPTGRNPHLPLTMDLGRWHGSEAATADRAVIEYADESRLMRWRFTRMFMSDDEWREQGHEVPADPTWRDTDEAID